MSNPFVIGNEKFKVRPKTVLKLMLGNIKNKMKSKKRAFVSSKITEEVVKDMNRALTVALGNLSAEDARKLSESLPQGAKNKTVADFFTNRPDLLKVFLSLLLSVTGLGQAEVERFMAGQAAGQAAGDGSAAAGEAVEEKKEPRSRQTASSFAKAGEAMGTQANRESEVNQDVRDGAIDRPLPLDSAFARNTGELGALTHASYRVPAEVPATPPEEALAPQLQNEGAAGGADQGQSLTVNRTVVQPGQIDEVGDLYASVQNALEAEEKVNSNQGFNPSVSDSLVDIGFDRPQTERSIRETAAAVATTMNMQLRQFAGAVRSWPDLIQALNQGTAAEDGKEEGLGEQFREAVQAQNAADPENAEANDLRARWIIQNNMQQARDPTSMGLVMAGISMLVSPMTAPNVMKSGGRSGANFAFLMGLMGLAAIQSNSPGNIASLQDIPFGDDVPRRFPQRQGQNEDGATWDPGSSESPPDVEAGAGSLPPGAPRPPVPEGHAIGIDGPIPPSKWNVAAGVAAVNRIARILGITTAAGLAALAASMGFDSQPKVGEQQPTPTGPTPTPTPKPTPAQGDPMAGEAPGPRVPFTEEAITVNPGLADPNRPTQLRPTFRQEGSDLLNQPFKEVEKDKFAFAAFNKVTPWNGDVPKMQREQERRRFTNTIQFPVDKLTRRQLIELMYTSKNPRATGPPTYLSRWGDPRALGQYVDTSRESIPPVFERLPTRDQQEFPFQTTDGVYEDMPPIEFEIPADNKMLPTIPIQSTQPVSLNSGYQKWYRGNTVINPPEGSQRSLYPERQKNKATGSSNLSMTFSEGNSYWLPKWPIGITRVAPLPRPFMESARTTTLAQTTNPPEVSYDRSMNYQTGRDSVFKPLPFI